MAWSLAEAQKMTNDVLIKGVIETIIKESPILDKLPFQTIKGNGWTYVRETTQPTASWYSVGDTWTESTGTRTQYTAALKILGGDSDLDLFEKETMSDQNDLEAQLVEEKAKAMAHEFEDAFIYGDDSVNAKQFDGLHLIMNGQTAQQVHMSASLDATGAGLSMAKLDQMIDLVKPGRPDCLIMNRTIRRRLQQYYREGTGISFVMKRGEDGRLMETYGDIPLFVSDFITQTETIASGIYSAKTGGATSSIFAVKFGPKALCGGENGGIQKKRIGELESKDAIRWRLKWYVTVALMSTLAIARLDGITDVAATD